MSREYQRATSLCNKYFDFFQSVFLMTVSVDYLVARFLPHFHRTSPFSYRIALVAIAYSTIIVILAVTAILDYIDGKWQGLFNSIESSRL